MTGRRAIVGLSVLCALIFSAVSVSSAAAATEDTTAFECTTSTTTKTFSDEHCINSTTGTKEWGHKVLTGAISVTGTNAKTKNEPKEATTARLVGTIAGITIESTCVSVSSAGTLENAVSGRSPPDQRQ